MMCTKRRAQSDEGFTLVELLVVIVLLGVISALVSTGVIGAMRTTKIQDDETQTLNTAKIAMERVTREIRGANALVVCQPRTMTFTYTRRSIRTSVTFTVSSDNATQSELTQDKTVTDLATGVASTTHTKVLGGLAIGRSDAVFTYADAAGTPLTPDTLSPESYSAGATKTVGVKILMRRIQGHPSVQLYQLVSLRNYEV